MYWICTRGHFLLSSRAFQGNNDQASMIGCLKLRPIAQLVPMGCRWIRKLLSCCVPKQHQAAGLEVACRLISLGSRNMQDEQYHLHQHSNIEDHTILIHLNRESSFHAVASAEPTKLSPGTSLARMTDTPHVWVCACDQINSVEDWFCLTCYRSKPRFNGLSISSQTNANIMTLAFDVFHKSATEMDFSNLPVIGNRADVQGNNSYCGYAEGNGRLGFP